VKIHCSILAEDAIKAAVADYKAKHGASAAPAAAPAAAAFATSAAGFVEKAAAD
ncbi:MAG: iron-sulfur cluster assembly scaffold protein, partial [Casimicrobiaceae bacterium]